MRFWLLCSLLAALPAWGVPRVPADDREVLETLPVRPSDPLAAELRKLRAPVAATPPHPPPAVKLARRYFALARARGAPRSVGSAAGARRPGYATASRHAEVLTARGLLRQSRHDFDGALEDLAAAA